MDRYSKNFTSQAASIQTIVHPKANLDAYVQLVSAARKIMGAIEQIFKALKQVSGSASENNPNEELSINNSRFNPNETEKASLVIEYWSFRQIVPVYYSTVDFLYRCARVYIAVDDQKLAMRTEKWNDLLRKLRNMV